MVSREVGVPLHGSYRVAYMQAQVVYACLQALWRVAVEAKEPLVLKEVRDGDSSRTLRVSSGVGLYGGT